MALLLRGYIHVLLEGLGLGPGGGFKERSDRATQPGPGCDST
jgi:hypothetical protein